MSRTVYYYCHECKDWQPCKRYSHRDGGEWYCRTCGETILCDECGQPWTSSHESTCAAKGGRLGVDMP